MPTRFLLILPALLILGCAGSPAVKPAQAARSNIAQAEKSNATATQAVDRARTDAQRIDDKAVVLLKSKWKLAP